MTYIVPNRRRPLYDARVVQIGRVVGPFQRTEERAASRWTGLELDHKDLEGSPQWPRGGCGHAESLEDGRDQSKVTTVAVEKLVELSQDAFANAHGGIGSTHSKIIGTKQRLTRTGARYPDYPIREVVLRDPEIHIF